MPTHEEHCQDSLRRYRKRFDELHRWMDEPWEDRGKAEKIGDLKLRNFRFRD
jgi:hypothetical protein